MIAAALALGAVTVEHAPPFCPTLSERFHIVCAMERYANTARLGAPDAVMAERMRATDDLVRVVALIVARACEEFGVTGNAGSQHVTQSRERGTVGGLGQARETCAPRCAGQNSTVIASAVGSRS